MKLPKTLYVRVEEGNGDDAWLSADASLNHLMSDDGPSRVGVYQLVEIKQV